MSRKSGIPGRVWRQPALGLALVLLATMGAGAEAAEGEVAITGREVVERLTRLEEGLKRLEQRIDAVEARLGQRIDALGQRSDALGQRIDGVQASLGQRIDDLRQLVLVGFGVTFAGMFALVGFVIWDRRTALAPAVRRIAELQERERRLEEALKDYAAKSPGLAESLKKEGLL